MDKNIYPYPCTECSKKDECVAMCSAYKKWFKEEWNIVTEPFRLIRNNRDERREK